MALRNKSNNDPLPLMPHEGRGADVNLKSCLCIRLLANEPKQHQILDLAETRFAPGFFYIEETATSLIFYQLVKLMVVYFSVPGVKWPGKFIFVKDSHAFQ